MRKNKMTRSNMRKKTKCEKNGEEKNETDRERDQIAHLNDTFCSG